MTVRGTVPEDLERSGVVVAEEPVVQAAPVRAPLTPGEWIRRNLFSSWWNGVLSVITGLIVVYATFRLLRFVFVSADWTVFKVNLRAYMVGPRFPVEDLWRVWAVVYLLAALTGLSRGAFPPRPWSRRTLILAAVLAALTVGALLYLIDSPLVWILLALAVAVFAGGVVTGRRSARRLRRPLVGAWILAFPVIVAILSVGNVSTQQWGGLLLNLIVAAVAIFVSFPIGLLLALGRRSSLPAVSAFCVGFIEIVRGVPLVTLLIFGRFVLPLLLPPQLDLSQIMRAMFMITIFSSAYTAEIVRGGLQGVPEGQYEASRALGLSTTRTMALVALPQALRSTIPSMIGHFISVFKDTSLLAALDIFSDLLDTADRASNDLRFVGNQAEALLPAAFFFWAIAFTMSRWSQRVERRLGVGER
jgi:general L-amino acid transport system permease protein